MNLKLAFRPLMSGVGIVPSTSRKWATLGLIARGGGRTWIVTAGHSLKPVVTNQPVTIFQGPWNARSEIVSSSFEQIIFNDQFDVAAAPLNPNIEVAPEVVHLGRWGEVIAPQEGVAVVRVGVGTGMVKGTIAAVQGASVYISRPSGYPLEYTVGEPGDSGALWLTWPNLDIVAIHRAKSATGSAVATALVNALPAMNLEPI